VPIGVPVVANVLAKPISDPADIARRLVEQVTSTVRWRECVAFMAGAGVTNFYELGAGKVLTGRLKRIAEAATGTAIGALRTTSARSAMFKYCGSGKIMRPPRIAPQAPRAALNAATSSGVPTAAPVVPSAMRLRRPVSTLPAPTS